VKNCLGNYKEMPSGLLVVQNMNHVKKKEDHGYYTKKNGI